MATLVIKMGMDCLVPEMQDRLIAPKISQFFGPQIPDLSAKCKPFIDALIMNNKLTLVLQNKVRRALFTLVRKTGDALEEYREARDFAFRHAGSDRRSASDYFRAVRHFENCLSSIRVAIDGARILSQSNMFQRKDGSVLQRAAALRGKVHHFAIEAAAAKDEISAMLFMTRADGSKHAHAQNLAAISTIPMWLTNVGLESAEESLSYQELALALGDMADDAETMVVMEPPKPKRK